MKTRKKKPQPKKPTPLQAANKAMRAYIKATAAKEIASEQQKKAKAGLLMFAKDADFGDDGNLQLRGGYIHKGKETVIVPCEGFNFLQFMQEFPELVNKSFKVAPIKALLQDEAGKQKLLQNHCVELKQEDSLEIVIDKKS